MSYFYDLNQAVMKSPVSTVKMLKFSGKDSEFRDDLLAGEEPLEIRLKYFDGIDFKEKKLAVTMRTPGNDFELAVGFLFTEGIIGSYNEVDNVFYCEEVKEDEAGNVIIVHLNKEKGIGEETFNRNFYINSSCGVCGKSSIDSLEVICSNVFEKGHPKINASIVHQIPHEAGRDQTVFKHTGGLHGAAIFDTEGKMIIIREDIGRHNALDKLIGARTIETQSNSDKVLFVSGRAGFELVQKAVVAGIPIMIAVGAPSSLAVDLANEYGITLIGFARNDKFNVYSGKERLSL